MGWTQGLFSFYGLGFLAGQVNDYGGDHGKHQHHQHSYTDLQFLVGLLRRWGLGCLFLRHVDSLAKTPYTAIRYNGRIIRKENAQKD